MRTATYNALQEIQHERLRQVSDEGWTPEHDDAHDDGELAAAAACYAVGEEVRAASTGFALWPWHADWWKPGDDRRRQLVKAGALIVAELERLERTSMLTRPLIDSDINGSVVDTGGETPNGGKNV